MEEGKLNTRRNTAIGAIYILKRCTIKLTGALILGRRNLIYVPPHGLIQEQILRHRKEEDHRATSDKEPGSP